MERPSPAQIKRAEDVNDVLVRCMRNVAIDVQLDDVSIGAVAVFTPDGNRGVAWTIDPDSLAIEPDPGRLRASEMAAFDACVEQARPAP